MNRNERTKVLTTCMAMVSELEFENKNLRDALKKYGRHLTAPPCESLRTEYHDDADCDCGFTEAKKEDET